ncbi:MAG TPA: fibrobacter succinogenes major paralogous domain-containing protein [Chryseolinea sp.]
MKNSLEKTLLTRRILTGLILIVSLLSACGDDDDGNGGPDFQHVQDIEDNVYPAVAIGSQVWMADNLKVTKYNDGTDIPYKTDNDNVGSLTTGAFSYYNKDVANSSLYGALYNWHSIATGKLCPSGWHVPSDAEWSTLINFLGGEDIAGGPLKVITTAFWNAPNEGATNDSGFSAMPAGYLYDNSTYYSLGNVTHWWTSTESDDDSAWDRYVTYKDAKALKGEYSKKVFYSCRCVKD